MKKALVVGLVLVLVAGVVAVGVAWAEAGNGGQQQAAAQPAVEVTCDQFNGAEGKQITRDVTVPTGGLVTVTLCSNPSTGFSWEAPKISEASVVEQVTRGSDAPDSDLVGASGKEVVTLKALKAGTSTVSMQYSRPWEGGEKGEWTFTLNVTVK